MKFNFLLSLAVGLERKTSIKPGVYRGVTISAKTILCLALVWGNPFVLAAAPTTNNPSLLTVHNWQYIQYPWNFPNRPTFVIGWPSGGNERSEELSRGIRLDILNITQGFTFFKTNTITARLYRANGEIVEPTPTGKKLLNAPVAGSTASFAGEEPVPQVLTYFPWGPNVLEEAWVEVTLGPERYWVEIPYGFDRNPAEPLAPSNTNGPPRFVPAMKSLTEHDHIVRWENIKYDLIQKNHEELSLKQANQFDAQSEVVLYSDTAGWRLDSPKTAVRIIDADGIGRVGVSVDLHLGDNHWGRTDTFQFGRYGDDLRCWGQIEISVGDQIYRVVVPSSLYKYIHGHAYKPSATDFLSKLNTGMTLQEAERYLRNYNYNDVSNTPALDHQYKYIFKPDSTEVTLQFDASDRLISWK